MASPTPLLLVWWHAPIEYFQPKLGPSQSRQWQVFGQVPQSHRRLYNLQRPLRIPNLYYPIRAITRPAECEALGASLRLKAIPVSFTTGKSPPKEKFARVVIWRNFHSQTLYMWIITTVLLEMTREATGCPIM